MHRVIIVLILGTQIVVPIADAQARPAVELEGAIAKEQVDGDLKAAIAAYQRIGANTTAPRSVRAKALLHLARAYERLGQQAQNIYQQIVRDFADQPAAAQARTRLGALQQGANPTPLGGMNQHRIGTLDDFNLGPSPSDATDGRRGVYRNDATGELILGSLDGKSKRVIYKGKPEDESMWSPSRDFSMVALLLSVKPGQHQTLAIIHADGTGYRELAKLDPNQYYYGVNWSWDNRYLLISGFQFNPGRILSISVADGKVREVLNIKTPVHFARFSPDGNYIAFHDRSYRLYILPATGGQPRLLYEEPSVATNYDTLILFDWTADGRHLVIALERTGRPALHILPVKNGNAAGPPIFVRYGHFLSARTTAAGELIYSTIKPGGIWTIHIAELGSDRLVTAWKRLDLQLGNVMKPWANFSADGTQIAYIATKEDAGQADGNRVRLFNLANGHDREIYQSPGIHACVWAVQQPALLCVEYKKGKADIVSLPVDSGQIKQLHTLTAGRVWIAGQAPDEGALYLFSVDGPSRATKLTRWEQATGIETIIEESPAGVNMPWLSADGRSLVWARNQGFETRPISGGPWKPVVSWHAGAFVPRSRMGVTLGNCRFTITPDGTRLLYQDTDSAGSPALFRVPLTGGSPERIGDFPSKRFDGSLTISPDGRRILSETWEGAGGLEVWSLQNFVPSGSKN